MARTKSPNRRTAIVLTSLMAAMTFGAGLLLALEPSPVAPSPSARLVSMENVNDSRQVLFGTTAQPAPWAGIVIHDSGSLEGSLTSIHKVHEKLGIGGLGYHFVVGNGKGAADGQIEMGFRWQHQMAGAHSSGEHADWFNRSAISICLVGDTDRQAPSEKQTRELLWLVRELQARFNIPSDRIYIQTGSGKGANLFPVTTFRQQLAGIH